MSMSTWRHSIGKTFMASVAVAVVGGLLPSSATAHAMAARATATSPAAQAPDAVPAEAEAASALAAETGDPVEVLFERTEYSEVFAQPDGSFKLTQSTTPQRVRESDGSWKPVDVTLAKRTDGRIAPKAAVVDLSFSGKGDGGDLIRIGDRNGHILTLGWDRSLPEPVLEGDTATYREVLPGVDLRLTATAESYREVLVVKTPQAAASPELDKVLFSIDSQGLEVRSTANGGLMAGNEDGVEIFTGPPGRMWDSAGEAQPSDAEPMMGVRTAEVAGQSTAVADDEQAETDPAAGPSDGDASAVMPVQVTDDSIAVVPDTEVLEGAQTVYPVYIDPAVGVGHTYRTVLSSDGDDFWMFDGAGHGIGRCGYNSQGACTTGSWYTNRMYFQFNSASALRGKYVIDATFRAYETWSFDCNPAWVDLERTDGISSGSKWPGPGGPKADNSWDQMGDKYISAGRGTACSPEQPNAWIEFNDNPAEPDENLKSTVRNFADGKIDNLTLMLKAKDESDVTAWKRFDDNAELQVDFAYQPGVPTRYGLWPGNPGGDPDDVQCATSSSNPIIVTRAEPWVQASVQTKVEHNEGNSEGSLQAEWVMERKQSDGTWASSWSDYKPDSGWDPDGTVETAKVSPRADKSLYRVKARTQSHWTYEGKSGDLFSSYTPWCYFKVDLERPKPPVVTAVTGGIYTVCVTEDCAAQGGPGVQGKLHFAQNAADTDVVKYEWLLPGMTKTDFATGASVDEPVTPLVAGRQTLQVRGWDSGGSGEWAYVKIKVQAATGAIGRWHFDDSAAGSQDKLARDTATEGTVRHDVTMYTDGTGFSSLARRGGGTDGTDRSLWLDSTDPAKQQGYAATATPPTNTADSFTISTWAYLTDTSVNRVAMAQPGANANAFALYYSTAYNAWVFNRTDQDKAAPVFIRSIAEQKPQLKVWTHVAGVFKTEGDDGLPDTDPTNDTIQLFVNGQPQGQPVKLASATSTYQPWSANGGLQWARSVKSGVGGEFFRGRLDETAVWQRALTEPEIRIEGELKENEAAATELMAGWDASTSTGSTLTEKSGYPFTGMTLAAGATLTETPQVLTLNGTTGYASTSGPAVDETGSFTVSALTRVDSAQMVGKADGHTVTVAKQKIGNEASWALKLIKLADDIDGDNKPECLWRFERTRVDGSGNKTSTTQVSATAVAVLDELVHVTGVYNAADPFADGDESRFGKLHLFVGADEQVDESTEANFADPQQGTGELAIGRGHANGTPGEYLPGAVQQLRVWVGAMESRQIAERVLGEPAG
ncbi:LamG-like jellyroll fold domain-containing protein [Streptomyces sp. PAN_FS17]|uniref:LamG-like jellyroll fold domain-containing protein n=1 Tax=Streptomyces sp. PAN_FS17 TaxID=1855351 RepID=UPI00089D2A56|nr:LamG-like jellyroll fold domain-containing protein [Streptomyces sp. PAN_FS17]SEB60719.1 serine/threonine protein kinase [Streptomyces sp. PAN_FS17]